MIKAVPVLVVDDFGQAAARLAQSLRRLGDDPMVARSASEARDTLEQHEFKAVLVEMHLGGTSGLELCQEICWQRPDMAVLATAASSNPALVHEVDKAGAYDLLITPVSDGELCYRLERALKRRELDHSQRVLRELSAQWATSANAH